MKHAFWFFRRPTCLAILAGAMLSLGSLGCASESSLTVTCLQTRQTYRQNFTQAYSSRNANGDTDIILIDQATQEGLAGHDFDAPVCQVMHIRLLWSPTREMKAVTSNASIKWYVIGRSEPPGFLEYSGVAFVSSTDDNDATVLKVRNATLTLSTKHGRMTDWLGSSKLEGTFTAKQDREKVEKVLSQLNATVATAASDTRGGISSIAQ